jgi:flavorubredoxin
MERLRSHGIEVEEMGNLEEGLSPEDIDIIIATHLHPDHIVSAKDFPRAKIIVQKKNLLELSIRALFCSLSTRRRLSSLFLRLTGFNL